MRAFLAAVIVATGMAVGSAYVLDRINTPADAAFRTPSVELR